MAAAESWKTLTAPSSAAGGRSLAVAGPKASASRLTVRQARSDAGKKNEVTMDQQQEWSEESSSGIAFMTGLFAGTVIGAGIGLLCAPRRGSELRQQVADAASNVGRTVSKAKDDVFQRSRELYDRAREAPSRTDTEFSGAAPSRARGAESRL